MTNNSALILKNIGKQERKENGGKIPLEKRISLKFVGQHPDEKVDKDSKESKSTEECKWRHKSTEEKFLIKGQGIVQFDSKTREFKVELINMEDESEKLIVHCNSEKVKFVYQKDGCKDETLAETDAKDQLADKYKQSYWISLDKENKLIRYGKGPMLKKTMGLEYELDDDVYSWINNIDGCDVNIRGDDLQHVTYYRFPVTVDIPPIIKSSDEISLDEIDANSATVIENLSLECNILYNNIQGKKVTLNTDDFPDFADAINYSILTKDCMLYEKLIEKSDEFGKKNPTQTYLRVTVGWNKGNSPGVPFVLEIWPGGHYSPIHNHSDCNAVIKVLHGSITTQWFKGLKKEEEKPYDSAVVCEGQTTWLNKLQFQTHRLFNHNVPGNMCATIQCYMYDRPDDTHYEYFDYLDAEDKIKQFLPTSDWDYGDFKAKIKKEWLAYKEKIANEGIAGYPKY